MKHSTKQLTRQKAQKELEYFFWENESAMGIHSSYGALICALKYSTTHQDEFDLQAFNEMSQTGPMQDLRLATQKNRRILKIYQNLSAQNKTILEKYFDERQYDTEMARMFGPGIGLIPMTQTGRDMTQFLLQNPNRSLLNHFKSARIALKRQVNELLHQALDEYIQIAKEK